MRVGRKQRKLLRSLDAAGTKACNRIRKTKERNRRDARILAELKSGSAPYTGVVMSWLSRKLDKQSSKITQDEIKSLLK
jgi:hypothetical protein